MSPVILSPSSNLSQRTIQNKYMTMKIKSNYLARSPAESTSRLKLPRWSVKSSKSKSKMEMLRPKTSNSNFNKT